MKKPKCLVEHSDVIGNRIRLLIPSRNVTIRQIKTNIAIELYQLDLRAEEDGLIAAGRVIDFVGINIGISHDLLCVIRLAHEHSVNIAESIGLKERPRLALAKFSSDPAISYN